MRTVDWETWPFSCRVVTTRCLWRYDVLGIVCVIVWVWVCDSEKGQSLLIHCKIACTWPLIFCYAWLSCSTMSWWTRWPAPRPRCLRWRRQWRTCSGTLRNSATGNKSSTNTWPRPWSRCSYGIYCLLSVYLCVCDLLLSVLSLAYMNWHWQSPNHQSVPSQQLIQMHILFWMHALVPLYCLH